MNDKWHIEIPFKRQFVDLASIDGDKVSGFIDLEKLGLDKLKASISYDENNKPVITELSHPFESLPSHFTPMAFKVYAGTENSWPRVQLKASPAKILQGHNVYGPDDGFEGALEMFSLLAITYPLLWEMLDVQLAEIQNIDCTYGTYYETKAMGYDIIEFLSCVGNKMVKVTNKFKSSVYFNQGSEHGSIKFYLKEDELDEQIKEYKKNNVNGMYDHIISIMESDTVQKAAKNMLRAEATVTKRKLKSLGVPTLFFKFIEYQNELKQSNRSLVQELFMSKAKLIFDALEGNNMNVFNEEKVENFLRTRYSTVTPKGKVSYSKAMKLMQTFRNISMYGFDHVSCQMSKATFYKHVKAICAVGISKASLQNLKSKRKNAVIPLVQVVSFDFGNQHPEGYEAPKSKLINNEFINLSNIRRGANLRLVA